MTRAALPTRRPSLIVPHDGDYDWRADALASYHYALHALRLRLVASGEAWWRDCVEMYAWEAGAWT